MNKSTIREITFKLLYSLEIQKSFEEDDIKLFLADMDVTDEKIIAEITNDINVIKNNNSDIIENISSNLKSDWKLDRISKINLSLLKIAIYEIVYKKVPYKVVINEVVELAKKYGEDASSSFINGVLATVVKQQEL